MRPRRTAAALAVTAALLVAGCGDDGDDTQLSSESTTTSASPPTTAAATTSAGVTTTTTTAPATTAPPATGPVDVAGDPAITCGGGGDLVEVDVDGDGAPDTVLFRHDAAAFTASLEVCSPAWGGGFRLDELRADTIEPIDVDGDGAVELFYGGTTAMAKVVQVARLTPEGLVTVRTEDGEPLVLTDGYPEGTPPDGPRHAYGCGEAGESRGLLRVVLTIDASGYTAEVTSYRLDGARAVEAGATGEAADGSPGPGDLLAQADELAARLAPAC